MNASTRVAFLLLAVVIAVGAFVVLGGDDDTDTASSQEATAPEGTPVPEPSAGEAPERAEEATPAPPAEEPRTEPMETIRVEGGAPVGGVAELEADSGERVRFAVRSDVVDHVHVHGFDIMRDVGPGQVARFSFPADIEGVFEIELEDRGVPIAELTVSPG